MAQNCGKKDDYFLKIVDKKKHADWFLEVGECKELGLINHSRIPKIEVKVDVCVRKTMLGTPKVGKSEEFTCFLGIKDL